MPQVRGRMEPIAMKGLHNHRVWSFPCPHTGDIHYATPEAGVIHTISHKIISCAGVRELRAVKELSQPITLAREQMAGG